jgi:hypothetical protein
MKKMRNKKPTKALPRPRVNISNRWVYLHINYLFILVCSCKISFWFNNKSKIWYIYNDMYFS